MIRSLHFHWNLNQVRIITPDKKKSIIKISTLMHDKNIAPKKFLNQVEAREESVRRAMEAPVIDKPANVSKFCCVQAKGLLILQYPFRAPVCIQQHWISMPLLFSSPFIVSFVQFLIRHNFTYILTNESTFLQGIHRLNTPPFPFRCCKNLDNIYITW